MTFILDGRTGLPTDLAARVAACLDWLEDERVFRALLRRSVATPNGLETFRVLLERTVEDVNSPPSMRRGLGRGEGREWWDRYDTHVRRQMGKILEDRVVRRCIARRVMQLSGRSRRDSMEELQRLRVDLATQGTIPS